LGKQQLARRVAQELLLSLGSAIRYAEIGSPSFVGQAFEPDAISRR
jgi:hypothetical protein